MKDKKEREKEKGREREKEGRYVWKSPVPQNHNDVSNIYFHPQTIWSLLHPEGIYLME